MSHDAEMDAAMARIGVLRYRLEHAEIDKAHLKVELTDLKSTADRFEVENSILMNETARLLAEVDSLMTNPTSRLLRAEREENARLQAEVERLTKAGDAMEVLIVEELAFYEDDGSHYDEVKAWNAAKEGKQS
jgi:hypothetical protein